MSGQDNFTKALKAAAARWGMSVEEYQRRAVADLLKVERLTGLGIRSSSIRDIASALGESPEALTRRAVQHRMDADAQMFEAMHSRPGGPITKTGTKSGQP
jgi:hypothetical protein